VSVIRLPVSREAQLEQENKLLREQVRIIGALHMIERFHAFDGIKDDCCPACGGRVRVVEEHNSVRLEAVL
jgi:hypothetical protein